MERSPLQRSERSLQRKGQRQATAKATRHGAGSHIQKRSLGTACPPSISLSCSSGMVPALRAQTLAQYAAPVADMKKLKKQKNFGRSYRPVVIWLEDLAEIVSTLKENAQDVHISTEDYLFATVEELKGHFGTQTQFAMEVTGSIPYVRLELTRLWVKLHVSAGPQSAQLFHDIDSIFARGQRRFPFLYSNWMVLPILIGGPVVRFFPEQIAPIVGVQAVLAVWYLWVLFIRMRQTAVVNLQRRSEVRPFLERNKDQLLLLLIGGIVGGLITFAGVVAKERFYPSAPTVNATKPP